MADLMTEAKYMEEKQSLKFQTEKLKVAEEMAKTKGRVQILEEPCDKILEKKKNVTSMKSLLHNTFNHQNDSGRSTTVSVDAKLVMVNMDSDGSRESTVGYPKDVSIQYVPVRRIGIHRKQLRNQMKTWQSTIVVNPRDRALSNDNLNRKTSKLLWKLLQQQAAPEVDIDCFDGNPLNYHYFMTLFCEVVETEIEDPRGRLTRLIKYTVGEEKELIKQCIQLPHDKGYKYVKSLLEKTYGNPPQDFIFIYKRGERLATSEVWGCKSFSEVL